MVHEEKGSRRVSDDGWDGAQRAGSSATTLEQPRQTYVTTLSKGESLLTAWYQRGGGGRVQAPYDPILLVGYLRNKGRTEHGDGLGSHLEHVSDVLKRFCLFI